MFIVDVRIVQNWRKMFSKVRLGFNVVRTIYVSGLDKFGASQTGRQAVGLTTWTDQRKKEQNRFKF